MFDDLRWRCNAALLVALALALLAAGAAGARPRCSDWTTLGPDEKLASVEQLIQGHVYSKSGEKYTSENRILMQRCLERMRGQIVDEFDGACREGMSVGLDVLDEIFDRYFLSCVQ